MINFQNTFVPQGKNISIICFKQTIYLNGIYFYAQDLIEELSKTNNVSLYANTVFFNSLSPDVKNRIVQFTLFLHSQTKFISGFGHL